MFTESAEHTAQLFDYGFATREQGPSEIERGGGGGDGNKAGGDKKNTEKGFTNNPFNLAVAAGKKAIETAAEKGLSAVAKGGAFVGAFVTAFLYSHDAGSADEIKHLDLIHKESQGTITLQEAHELFLIRQRLAGAGEPGTSQYTKSNLAAGNEMHRGYKFGVADNENTFKEFTGIKGIRPDFVDFKTRTIFELKPNNPRSINSGQKQLEKYKAIFEQKYGGTWKTVLDTY